MSDKAHPTPSPLVNRVGWKPSRSAFSLIALARLKNSSCTFASSSLSLSSYSSYALSIESVDKRVDPSLVDQPELEGPHEQLMKKVTFHTNLHPAALLQCNSLQGSHCLSFLVKVGALHRPTTLEKRSLAVDQLDLYSRKAVCLCEMNKEVNPHHHIHRRDVSLTLASESASCLLLLSIMTSRAAFSLTKT